MKEYIVSTLAVNIETIIFRQECTLGQIVPSPKFGPKPIGLTASYDCEFATLSATMFYVATILLRPYGISKLRDIYSNFLAIIAKATRFYLHSISPAAIYCG